MEYVIQIIKYHDYSSSVKIALKNSCPMFSRSDLNYSVVYKRMSKKGAYNYFFWLCRVKVASSIYWVFMIYYSFEIQLGNLFRAVHLH